MKEQPTRLDLSPNRCVRLWHERECGLANGSLVPGLHSRKREAQWAQPSWTETPARPREEEPRWARPLSRRGTLVPGLCRRRKGAQVGSHSPGQVPEVWRRFCPWLSAGSEAWLDEG